MTFLSQKRTFIFWTFVAISYEGENRAAVFFFDGCSISMLNESDIYMLNFNTDTKLAFAEFNPDCTRIYKYNCIFIWIFAPLTCGWRTLLQIPLLMKRLDIKRREHFHLYITCFPFGKIFLLNLESVKFKAILPKILRN